MAWGVFKKIGDTAKKVWGKVQQGAKFVDEKLLPGARKVLDIVKPINPFHQQIESGLDYVDKGLDYVKGDPLDSVKKIIAQRGQRR